MSDAKHTPGPWVWWTSNSWKRLKRDTHGITQSVLEPYVCKDGHPDMTVSSADMSLIAAAPDLLAALEMVRDADEDCRRDGLPTIPHMARAKIDAAIAKAKGRST